MAAMTSIGCTNKLNSKIENNNNEVSEEKTKNINVDEFMAKLSRPKYAETDIEEVLLIRNYKDYIMVVEVIGNKIMMEIKFDDGVLNINGRFNIIDGENNYSIINKDGKYIGSDYNDVKYILKDNPTEESIKKNIMNYVDNKLFSTFNANDFIFEPSIGSNEISVGSIYSTVDNDKRVLETNFNYIHKDNYFNVSGYISLAIKEVDENSPPQINIIKNESKSLGTTAPNKEDVVREIPDRLTITGMSAKLLSQQEMDSISIINIEMKPKLGIEKGVIAGTYIDIEASCVKNIEIPFKIIKINNIYEIRVDSSGNYAL